jgi:HEXXH motif-containing protein
MSPESIAQELWDLHPISEGSEPVERTQSLDRAEQPLTRELAAELSSRGLPIRRRDTLADLAIQRAGMLIHCVPPLERIVLECVRELLVLGAPDEWHDVSHSEPRWPNLIFVSLPPPTPVGDVRLAEAIVHEAMHLNLSLFEQGTQVVAEDRQLFSPWRLGPRPASGVLHGVYVFASLLRFFESLQHQEELSFEQREHIKHRRSDILEECRQVPRNELWNSLTGDGQAIAQRVFETVDRRAFAEPSMQFRGPKAAPIHTEVRQRFVA